MTIFIFPEYELKSFSRALLLRSSNAMNNLTKTALNFNVLIDSADLLHYSFLICLQNFQFFFY